MTLLVRDEEDVLDANLAYHLNQGVDFVIATDNLSRDATPEILERYRREGLLHVIEEPRDTLDQARWVTRMARLAATEYGADWVINNDADEFWWPKHGTLRDVFRRVPDEYGTVRATRFNFVPRPEGEASFLDRMCVRELDSVRPGLVDKPLAPKMAHRARPDVVVRFGAHVVLGTDLATVPEWEPMVIFHFPVRSYAQLENKVVTGGRALQSNPNPGYNRALRGLFDLHAEGGLGGFYSSLVRGEADVGAGIAEGRLVVDRRLKRFLAGNGRGLGGVRRAPSGRRPGPREAAGEHSVRGPAELGDEPWVSCLQTVDELVEELERLDQELDAERLRVKDWKRAAEGHRARADRERAKADRRRSSVEEATQAARDHAARAERLSGEAASVRVALERSERRERLARKRLAAVEASRWWRLGGLLASLAARARRRAAGAT